MSDSRDGTVVACAPAKINLALEVLRPRPDGYHELDTVITTLDLADTVRISAHAGLEVHINGPEAAGIDAADDLAGRAARALAAAAGREPDVRIDVTKRVPVAAGLGGGSSDAAAVLRALNALWGLGWSVERLCEMGASLGSDVPSFVVGGVTHCTGRGEHVTPLKDLRTLRMLVLIPPVPRNHGKTARLFAALQPGDMTDGHRTQRLAARIARNAPPPTADLHNTFEGVIERTNAELVAHYSMFRSAGAPPLHLSGTGPAAYAFVNEGIRISTLRKELEAVGAVVYEARTLGRADALDLTREP